MNEFKSFFNELLKSLGIKEVDSISIEQARVIISKINEFFYTGYDGIGETFALGDNFEYFSEFHKFWEKYHKELLDPQIIEEKCKKTAEVFHDVYKKFGKNVFVQLYDIEKFKNKDVCRVRYFTAPQDFRGSRDITEMLELNEGDPSIFDEKSINSDPEAFLKSIGVSSLSQNDKRIKYAEKSAELLIKLDTEPYGLIKKAGNDIFKVREMLLANTGSGFGNKKTDMFLRDMVLLGVWKNVMNFDRIDVASDINTVKVALRAGILKTKIPLVSSFLDIFCYQYSLIDEMNAKAWRRVWEIWKDKYPEESIESPCMIDYLVYRIIGREFCKESLCVFECETHEHKFSWHSAMNKTCQVCFKNGKKNKAFVINKVLPCTSDEGYIFIEKNKFVAGEGALLKDIKDCPLNIVCEPKTPGFKKYNPPKSISILGQTGWDSARTESGLGGGGLMS
jgi:hypothetical protein